MTTHLMLQDRSVTACCGRTVFELPHGDRLTLLPHKDDCPWMDGGMFERPAKDGA